MSRWFCRRCGNRPLNHGWKTERGVISTCDRCGGKLVCLGKGQDLTIPEAVDENEDD